MGPDLGFCAPSGTRTPNPLKLAALFLYIPLMALTWGVTCAFAVRHHLWSPLVFGPFGADGGGVNRGVGNSVLGLPVGGYSNATSPSTPRSLASFWTVLVES